MESQDSGQTARQDALLTHVVNLVEPLTRFDRSALAGISWATERAHAAARQRFAVSFRVEQGSGTGRLPAGVRRLADAAAMQSDVEAATARELHALPERLDHWLETNASAELARPAASECMTQEAPVGFQWPCTACAGTGRVTCGACMGSRSVTCTSCQGEGRVRCGACGGNGTIRCLACFGRASWPEQRSRPADQPGLPDVVWFETVSCNSCMGRGTQSCGTCGTAVGPPGKVHCGTCFGTGNQDCSACRATGAIDCTACSATGWRHATTRLLCDVAEEFEVAAASPRDEVRGTLGRMGRIEDLRVLTPLTLTRSAPGAVRIEREFAADLHVTMLSCAAAGRSFEILGYGDAAHVLDFKGLVGGLLAADLDELEKAVAATWRVPVRAPASVAAALTLFLTSEANAPIAARLGTPRDKLEAFARDELRGAVSADYAVRAAEAIRGACSRLVWSGTPITATALLLVPFGLYWVIWRLATDATPDVVLWPLAGMTFAAVAAVGVMRWRAVRRVLRCAEAAEVRKSLAQGLAGSGTRLNWLLVHLATALVGTIGGWVAATHVVSH